MGGPPRGAKAPNAHPHDQPLKPLSSPEPVKGVPIGVADVVQPMEQRPADTPERRLMSQAMQDLYAESQQLREREAAKTRLQQQQQQRQNSAIGDGLERQPTMNGEGIFGVANAHRGVSPSPADGSTPPQQQGGAAGEEVALPRVSGALLRKKELRRTAMPKWAVNQLQAPDEPPPVFSVSRQRARSGENSLNSSVNLPEGTAAAAAAVTAVAVEDPFEKSSNSGAPAASILAESKILRVSRNSTPSSSEDRRSPRRSASLQSSTSAWHRTKERMQRVADAPVSVVGDVADVGAITAPMARRRREHRQQKAAVVAAKARRVALLLRSDRHTSPTEAHAPAAVKDKEGTEKAAPSTPAAEAAAVLTTSGADAAPLSPTTTTRTRSKEKEETKKKARAYREKKHAADKSSVHSSLSNLEETKAPAPYSGDAQLLKSVAAAIRDFFPADCSDYRGAIDAMPPLSCEELFSLYQAHQVLCKRLSTSGMEAGLGPTLCEAVQTCAAAQRTPQQIPPPPLSPSPPPPMLTATTSMPASSSPGKAAQRTAPASRSVTLLPDAVIPLLDDAPTAVKSTTNVGVTAASEPLSLTPKAPPRAVWNPSTVVLANPALTRSTRAVLVTAAESDAAAAARRPPVSGPLRTATALSPRRSGAPAAPTVPSPKKRRSLANFLSCTAPPPTANKNGADNGKKPKGRPVAARVGRGTQSIPRHPLLTSMEYVPHEGTTVNVDDAMRLYELWQQHERAKLQNQISTAKAKMAARAASSSPGATKPTAAGGTASDSASQDSSLYFTGRAFPSNRSLNSLRMNGSNNQSMSKTVLDLLHRTYAPATPPAEGALQLASFTPQREQHGPPFDAHTSPKSSSLSPPSSTARRHTHSYLFFNADDTSLSHDSSVSEEASVTRWRPERRAHHNTMNTTTTTSSSDDGKRKTTATATHRALPVIADTKRDADVAPPPLLPPLFSFSMESQNTLATFSEASAANIFTEYFGSSPTNSEAASVHSSCTFHSFREDGSSSHINCSASVSATDVVNLLYTMPTDISWKK